MESAFQPNQVYTNRSHGLKHEIAVNGKQSVEKQHLRAQSRDSAPLKIPAKLPPPFYPQHQTPTLDNLLTSTKPCTMQQPLEQDQTNAPGGSNIRHSCSTDVVLGDEANSLNASPAQAPSPRSLMYPPFPGSASSNASRSSKVNSTTATDMLPGPFPAPGLTYPLAPYGFNPQANAFQFGSQMPTRSHSPSSHDLQSPIHPTHHTHAGSISVHDTSGNALNAQAGVTLKNYLEFQFGSLNFSDVTVKITERAQSAEPAIIQAHRIILARSPKLRELVALDTAVVHIDLEAKYLETNTFIHVLRYLYGAALPTRNSLAGEPMDQSLALAAAGWTCGLPEVTTQGLDYASSWMSWDNVEKALEFALEGGLTPFFQFDKAEALFKPTFGEFAGQFLHFILNWLATNFPTNFQFITNAPQLADSPRLPGTLENRPSMANPRLSRIRFGDLPSEEHSQSTTLLSSIMLSLPFGPLRYLLLHPAFWVRPRHVEMARAVIQERETRRKKARQSKRYLPGATSYMHEAMYWEESIVSTDGQHSEGFTLVRECLKTMIGELGEDRKKNTDEES
jgi:hypothetical protein